MAGAPLEDEYKKVTYTSNIWTAQNTAGETN